MSKNTNMNKARKEKDDEFYTNYTDIEKEVMRYREQFENKIVLCNCDDPVESNFWQFFHRNFSFFKLKKLISTHYIKNGSSYAQIYNGMRDEKEPLTRNDRIDNNEDMDLFTICSMDSDGDFRSEECLKYLEEADIVCTNPPFSLFREFISTLSKYNKKFLIVGNFNATTYGEVFSLIKNNKLWTGYNWIKSFKRPDGSSKDFGNICWFTNLENTKKTEEYILYKEYNEEEYPHYDNFNAININKMAEIPCDYFGYMGVPISIAAGHNENQFEILGIAWNDKNPEISKIVTKNNKWPGPYIKGKKIYTRIFIRRKYDNNGLLVADHYDINGNLIK